MSSKTYEGLDRNGRFHRVERRFEPVDPLRLLPRDASPRWNGSDLPVRVSARELDALMERRVPTYVRTEIDAVLERARTLAQEGLAEEPPADRAGWRRSLILSWHHAVDVATVCQALGHARPMSLGNHDLCEYVPAARVRVFVEDAPSPWYARWLETLAPGEMVNVGFLNPHLCASLCRWGEAKVGTQNAMDAHRLSGHHLGNPDSPVDWIERSVNFVCHHLPREHYGIRHEPLCGWEELDQRIATDPAIKDDPIEQAVVADVRIALAALEVAGFLVPWHRMERAEGATPQLALEHSRAVLEDHLRQARRHRDIAGARMRSTDAADSRRARTLDGPSEAERGPVEGAGLGDELVRVLSAPERHAELLGVFRRARDLALELPLTEAPEVLVRHMARLARAGTSAPSLEASHGARRRARSLDGTTMEGTQEESNDEWPDAEPDRLIHDHADLQALIASHVDLPALAARMEQLAPGSSAELTLEALASEIHVQLEQGSGRRARFLFGHTAVKQRDVIAVAGSISVASPIMLLLGSQLKLYVSAAVLGGIVALAMVAAGLKNQTVPLTSLQVAVLLVLKQTGVSLTPETIQQRLLPPFRRETLESVRATLKSLTEAPARSGEPKKLVIEKGGRWSILDV